MTEIRLIDIIKEWLKTKSLRVAIVPYGKRCDSIFRHKKWLCDVYEESIYSWSLPEKTVYAADPEFFEKLETIIKSLDEISNFSAALLISEF